MSNFEVTRYPLKGKRVEFSIRVKVKDKRRPDVWLNDIVQLRHESGHWRIFLHGTNQPPVIHCGTLKSAIATYNMLRP